MRLIDADALMRDIEHYHVSDGKFQHWVEVQPTIETERKKGKWIPCSEQLPEKEGIYIVTDDAGGMTTVSTDEFSHYEDGEPMWMFSQNVTAWMPLPEGYRGEQDG